MTIEVNDHEHVWVRRSPALSFILLEPDPVIYCSLCGVHATQCEQVVFDGLAGTRCTLIAGHTGEHSTIPGEQ